MIDTHTKTVAGKQSRVASNRLIPFLLEWRIVALTIIGILVLTAIPYWYAYTMVPQGKYYTGLMLGIPDHLQYFAWMRDLAHQNLAANRLTPEPNEPAFFNLLWWSVGHIGVVTGLELGALYTLLRICAVALCLSCGYAFFTQTIANEQQRKLAFLIFALAGGLGVIWVGAKYALRLNEVPFPDDLYSAEPNTFFMSLAFPHFTLASGLLVGTFSGVLQAIRTGRLRWAVLGGIVAIVLGTQHTYDLLTVYLVFGLFGALLWVRDRRFPTFLFLCGAIVVGMSAPPALYMFLLVQLNPVWGAVLAQFDNAGVFTPSLPHLFILLGIPFWLALAYVRPSMFQSKNDMELFVLAWFVAHFGLIYMPTDFQIHMLLGWQFPIAVLASGTLVTYVWPWLKKKSRGMAAVGVGCIVALMLATNSYLIAWRVLDLGRYENPYFLTTNQTAALDWLEANTTRDDVVLADLSLGQFVPMWTDARSFVAHWANTLNFFEKQKQAKQLVTGEMPANERNRLLNQFQVSYIIYEGNGSAPWVLEPGYREAYRQGDVVVYQVVR
jgi:hypothetical protein